MTNKPEFKDFIEGVQSLVNSDFAKHYPTLVPNLITFEEGRRYVRIVSVRRHKDSQTGEIKSEGRSVWGFVDKTNGDILKAAGWKAPAKHARGNIFSANPFQGCDWTGPAYLR